MKGSAGYVAMERVTGNAARPRGDVRPPAQRHDDARRAALGVTVVPDSGTGALAGLAGKMAMSVEGGKHSYEFEYSLPEVK